MRILMIMPSFPKLSEVFLVNKFHGLLRRGWDVHVVCNGLNRDIWDSFQSLRISQDLAKRVHVVPNPARKLDFAVRVGWLVLTCCLSRPRVVMRYFSGNMKLPFLDKVRQLLIDIPIIALNPDIIHFEFGAIAVRRASLRTAIGCKVVVSFRGYDLNYVGLDSQGYYDDVWREADAFHFLGEALKRQAVKRGLPPNSVHVLIPPAPDDQLLRIPLPEVAEPAGTEDRPFVVLSVGRLEWVKGYEYSVSAIGLLKRRSIVCKFIIIGDGPFFEAVSFAIHQEGIQDCVELKGGLPHEEVMNTMQSADIFLHGAVSEGFCNAVLEAQAAGLPVVCTDAGGLPENVIDGVTGFVVPRRDSKALAEKMELLARSHFLRAKLGRAGRLRVSEAFKAGEQILRFENLYRSLLYDRTQIPTRGSGGV